MIWRSEGYVLISIALAIGTKAAKTWASIPIHGPTRLEGGTYNRHYAEALLGTPPQNTSFAVDIATPNLFVHTSECIFCLPGASYDPSYSSSARVNFENTTFGDTEYGGSHGNETMVFGGVLQALESPILFVEHTSTQFDLPVVGGRVGLFVPPAPDAVPGLSPARSVLLRLHGQDQLLNPVWGLRLGGENPRLTIGALDPNEYQGEINWVPAITENGYPVIEVDSLRGYQGNVFPYQYPIKARLDSFAADIGIPDLATYWMNETLLGPQEVKELTSNNNSFAVLCNDTLTLNSPVELSAEINGIVYPLGPQEISRPSGQSMQSTGNKFCRVGVTELRANSTHKYLFGLTFVRSVYLAYRFPTANCPGYWGFATPKGSSVPPSTQAPRATPTDASTCLSFVKPTSTPTPTTTAYSGLFGSNGERYPVYARPDDQWVELRGANDLKIHKVTGGSARKEA